MFNNFPEYEGKPTQVIKIEKQNFNPPSHLSGPAHHFLIEKILHTIYYDHTYPLPQLLQIIPTFLPTQLHDLFPLSL